MSKPLTVAEISAAFKKWNVPHRIHKGAENHRRDPEHGEWGPVHGLVLHHTGDDAPDNVDEKTVWTGRSDLPGPLCTWGMDDEGKAVINSGGRSNHAGGGDPRVLDAVINENYKDYPPQTHEHEGSAGSVDGNISFYGQETFYSGSHKMKPIQYQNTVLAFAAICDAHKWSAKSAIGHKEWSDWKPDPGHVDMADFRKDVQDALDAGPGNWPTHEVKVPHVTPQMSVVDFTNVKRQFLIAVGAAKGHVTRHGGVRAIQEALNHRYGFHLKLNGLVDKETLKAWAHHEKVWGGRSRPRVPDVKSLQALSKNFEIKK